MEKGLFDDLVQSLEEARAISKNERAPSRTFKVDSPDVKALREQLDLSQSEFARLLHVSIETLQNWEQHRRNPAGPAVALLKIVGASPQLALSALHG